MNTGEPDAGKLACPVRERADGKGPEPRVPRRRPISLGGRPRGKGPAHTGTSPRGRPYVPEFAPLLRGLPLGGWVLTIDAAHTVRAHAHFITEQLLAHYVMIVKQNTKGLYDRLNTLDWASIPVAHRSVDTGHGRREIRTIQVMDAPADLGFPHAAQVFLLERYTTRKVRKRHKNSRRYKTVEVTTAVAVLGVTSLSAREAAPRHLATYVRGHWSIENRIHWVRM
jgi:predicted transposase YbfD/YdcC